MRNYYCCDEGFRLIHAPEHSRWIEVTSPDEDDRHFLMDENMPEVFLEYLQDADERARVERDGDWRMTIVRIPVKSDNDSMPFKTVPLGVINRSDDKVFTVCFHSNEVTEDFARHTRHKGLDVCDVGEFTLRIFFSTSFWFLHYLKLLTNDVTGTEKALEKSVQNDDLLGLMRLQKSLVFFNTSIKGNVMVLERIQNIYGESIDRDLMEDVEIELRQADTTVEIYSNILEGTMDTYASIISNNMNGVMKRMTGLTLILMVPTFVASLYGMNVDILLTGHFAFWQIIGIACVLTAIVFILLRRLKWV